MLVLGTPPALEAQVATRRPVNQDESKVPSYTLPDPLVRADGRRVTTADEWRRERRPELFALFEREVYGVSPARPAGMWFETRSVV